MVESLHEAVAERDQFREQARQSEMWIEQQGASGRKVMEAKAEAEYWKLEVQRQAEKHDLSSLLHVDTHKIPVRWS